MKKPFFPQRISRYAALGLLAACLLSASPADAEPAADVLKVENERIAAIERASKATVAIFARAGAGGGSGVLVTPDGYALTNFHVVKPAGNAMKCGLNDGKLYDAVIVSVDPTGDVALIKLLGRDDFPVATLADSDKVRVGDWCFAAGNPFLLANDFHPTITFGVVSGTHRYQYPAGTLLEYADCIQTDAAINPGNSGGPLFDARGELIGINGRGSFEKRGRINVGVGYAISINQIKYFMGYLRSGRIVDHATLGATVSSDEEGRVIVNDILESSDAFRRGLRYGDEIVRFGNREIHTVNAFKNVLGIYPRGWRVPITFRRDGKTYDSLVRLRKLHLEEELIQAVSGGGRPAHPPTPKEKPKKEDEPEGKEKKLPKLPLPKGIKLPTAAKMPAKVKAVYEKREGYSNYYFNKLNRDRIWKAFSAHGDFKQGITDWEIDAQRGDNANVKISLSGELGKIVLPEGESKASFAGDLYENLNPPGSGGLLAALHLWRRLLAEGPATFGEVYYLGSMPIPTQQELVDVLVGIHGGIETRFFFHTKTGHLVGLEMFSDDDADPCEVYFRDYRKVSAHQLPHTWEIRYGDNTFATLEIKQYTIDKKARN